MKFENVLTITLLLVVAGSVGLLFYNGLDQSTVSYNSSITHSIARETHNFDYSCNQEFYTLYLRVTNAGEKVVRNFSISISNELCKGAIPPIPAAFEPGQTLGLYLYTTKANGTIAISGNHTNIYVKF